MKRKGYYESQIDIAYDSRINLSFKTMDEF